MKIVTHDGKFHSDETFAIALLIEIFGECPIERTRTISDDMLNDPSVWVLDVSEIYSPKNHNFDHHNLGLASTNVLVLNYLYEKEIIDKDFYMELKRAFLEISAIDNNGDKEYNGFQVTSLISKLNYIKEGFDMAVTIARCYIIACKESSRASELSRKIWNSGLEFSVKEVKAFKVCNSYPKHWKRYADYPMLVCPHQTIPNEWQLLSIDSDKYPIKPTDKELFIHNNLFIATYKTKADATEAALNSFSN